MLLQDVIVILSYVAASTEVRTDYTDLGNVMQSAVVNSVERLSNTLLRCEFRILILQ
jgi:hypothetical protein